MGDTGPCGPCTRDPLLLRRRQARPRAASARSRTPDGTRLGRDLEPRVHAVRARRDGRHARRRCPRRRIDTGMGLERARVRGAGRASATTTPICCAPLVELAAQIAGKPYGGTLGARRRLDARDRRPRAHDGVPDRRGRVPRPRRARVRAAPRDAPRDPPRPPARHRASRSCTRCALRGRRADGRRSTRSCASARR